MSRESTGIETIWIDGTKMYRVTDQLFLRKQSAVDFINECICPNCYRGIFSALTLGYSYISDEDFTRRLKDGKIRGFSL